MSSLKDSLWYAIPKLVGTLMSPPISARVPRPSMPTLERAERFDLGHGISLWRLPLGYVRVRERHRQLEPHLSNVSDLVRFAIMLADDKYTDWLGCTGWLIEHPEKTILVDTGDDPHSAEAGFFLDLPAHVAHAYPRIVDGAFPPEQEITGQFAEIGKALCEVDECVLTHLHSDHLGNLQSLSAHTRIIVHQAETEGLAMSGRLPYKLPRNNERLCFPQFTDHHPVLGACKFLTSAGDLVLWPTPGHTPGHCCVLIDLGERQVVVAGDAAFNWEQVQQARVPGIVENLRSTLATYEVLDRLSLSKPTCFLFSHDSGHSERLLAHLALG